MGALRIHFLLQVYTVKGLWIFKPQGNSLLRSGNNMDKFYLTFFKQNNHSVVFRLDDKGPGQYR